MTEPGPTTTYVCQLVTGTEAAVLVADAANPSFQRWLPRSRIQIEEGARGQLRITMPTALAREKGIATEPDDAQGKLL